MSRDRIEDEKRVLNEFFGELVQNKGYRFILQASGGEFQSLHCVIASQSGKKYALYMDLNRFPDGLPKIYVQHPHPLCRRGGESMAVVSGEYHTLSPNEDGHVQICHYGASQWHANISLVKCVLRSKIWLDAYEQHLKTGKTIDTWLAHAH